MKRKGIWVVMSVAVVMALLIGASSCAAPAPTPTPTPTPAPTPAPTGPIKIGMLAALTGPVAPVGIETVDGVKMAIKEINAAGGVMGRQVELVVRDDKAYVDEHTAELVTELIQKEGVVYVTGAISDSVSWAMKETAIPLGVPLLSLTPSFAESTRGGNEHPWFLIALGDTDHMAWGTLPYLLSNNLVSKKFVTVGPDYEWGWASARSAKKIIEAFGGEVVKDIVTPVPLTRVDTEIAIIDELLAGGGTIYICSTGSEYAMFHKAFYEAGFREKGIDIVQHAAGNPTGWHYMVEQEVLEGTWQGTDEYHYRPGDEIAQDYIKRYTSEFGYPPGMFSTGYYILNYLALKTMNEVQSLDSDVWTSAMRGVPFSGIASDVTMYIDELSGRLIKPYFLLRGKSREEMVDRWPDIPELDATWDHFEIVWVADTDYMGAIVPDEAVIKGYPAGGPLIGDEVMKYWE